MYALVLTSVRCTAFILQYALVYRTSAELKTGDEWTKDLSASFYAISLDYFRTWIGDLLLPHYSLLQMLTYVVLWWELWGPLFLVSPFYTQGSRLIGVLGFMGMHLGFGLSLRLGTFFYVSLAIATALLPPMFWTWFLSYLRTPKRMALKVSYVPSSLFSTTLARLLSIVLIPDTIFAHIQSKLDPESGVPMELLRSTPLLKCSDYYGTVYTGFEALSFALSHSPLLWPLGWFLSTELATTIAFNPVVLFLFVHFARFVDSDGPPAAVKPNRNPQARVANKLLWFAIKSMFVTICAVTVTAWCLGNIGHTAYKPEFTARGIAYLTHLDQSWGMFAPRPPSSDYYYVFEGQLDDGRMVELFNDRGFKTWNRIRPMRCVRLSSLGGFYVRGVVRHGDAGCLDRAHSWEKPTSASNGLTNHRWFKIFENYNGNARSQEIRLELGKFVCRMWNTRHKTTDRVYTYKVWLVSEQHLINGSTVKQPNQLLWHRTPSFSLVS